MNPRFIRPAQDDPADAGDTDDAARRLNEIAVDPFPLSVLPTPLAEFVAEASCAISCPPDYVAVPMLAVLGTAIGTRRRIQIKESWCEWPILWTAMVGDTGTAKSPAQEKAVEPLVRLQNKLLAEFEEATKAMHFAKKAVADAKEKAARPAAPATATEPARKAMPGSTELPPQGPTPQLSQVFTTDTTLEALNVCLARNPDGITLVRDELTAWVLSMNEYKKGSGADRPYWQSMWNGSQIVVNRKNNFTPIIIPRPFVCVVGGLPPEMLGELCDEQGREDGFIHRILFAFPDPMPRILTDEGVSPKTLDRYCELFDKLRRLRRNLLVGDPTVTHLLAPNVFAVFKEWANEHYAEMESGPANLRGPWAKLVTYCARLALIIHLAHKVCGDAVSSEVDEESVHRAITLVGYFKSHARRVYDLLHASPQERQISAAIGWLKKRPGGVASLHHFVSYKVAGMKRSDHALELFQKLEQNEWGRIERSTPATGGRETIQFRLNRRLIADRLQMPANARK